MPRGASGRKLRANPEWANPTGKWRVGSKRLFELIPRALQVREPALTYFFTASKRPLSTAQHARAHAAPPPTTSRHAPPRTHLLSAAIAPSHLGRFAHSARQGRLKEERKKKFEEQQRAALAAASAALAAAPPAAAAAAAKPAAAAAAAANGVWEAEPAAPGDGGAEAAAAAPPPPVVARAELEARVSYLQV